MGHEAPVHEHVAELRKRLIYSIAVFAVAAGAAFYFSSGILSLLQRDLALNLHALTAYEVLYTQLIIAGVLGFVVALPFIAYQVLQFARPGLRQREYKTLRNFLPFSYVLFLAGAVFAYQVVVKNALGFFGAVTASSDVSAVWGLRNTLGFALKLSLVIGILFQLPLVALVLSRAGLLNAGMMRTYRVHVVVAVLLLAALATPPDIVSQLLVTVPVMLLYELSVFLVSWTER